MQIISGTEVRKELLEEYRKTISKENLKISLVIIQVGDNPSSNTYIRNKLKYTKEVGIKAKLMKLDESITEEELINIIKKLNRSKVTGIILQSPLPSHINFTKCARLIKDSKDVDGFSSNNLFAIRDNNEKIIPCTVKGILKLLEYYKIDVEGKNVVVIGRSNIVGRPLADALINRNATVTLCHSKTKNL
jgi:methylenetetrahydrofolate dehydrogenase (NADP+)/methenyltetrahydrofolate cyclohydrolase